MNAKDAFEKFLKVRSAVAGWTTQNTYRTMTIGFFRMFPGEEVDEVDLEMLAEWIGEMREHGTNPNTIKKKIGILKVFFAWCRTIKLMTENPLEGLPVLKAAAVHKVPFTYEQHQSLLELIATGIKRPRQVGHYPKWDHLCSLGWHLGLRFSDCCFLKWDQIDFVSDVITARPHKRAHVRQIIGLPIEPELRDHLVSLHDNGCEFVDPEARHDYYAHRREMLKDFRFFCDRCGLPEHSFHSYRHGFVTRLLNAGIDAVIIADMTGHTLEMIRGYAHISTEAKASALAKSREPFEPKLLERPAA